ncbi:DUF3933 family protein [Ectobacillus panaciterrae]|uniref:DUF3933 family protein n=1 Tax=Ectobacillus panaciterrae TaxID=363872 RepID=UPI00041F5BB6|nr:DUF3933 family protein [Ectobacillus panaciterrae]
MDRYVICRVEEDGYFIYSYAQTFEEAVQKAEECSMRSGDRFVAIPEEKLKEYRIK